MQNVWTKMIVTSVATLALGVGCGTRDDATTLPPADTTTVPPATTTDPMTPDRGMGTGTGTMTDPMTPGMGTGTGAGTGTGTGMNDTGMTVEPVTPAPTNP